MKKIWIIVMLGAVVAPLAGCVVYPARPYPAAVWVHGHYGPYGGWKPGHWA